MSKLLCLVALLFASPALAQQLPCKPLPEALEFLKTQHQEQVIWGGIAAAEMLLGVIITQSKEGGWSLLQVMGGVACLMATGTDGQMIDMGQPI